MSDLKNIQDILNDLIEIPTKMKEQIVYELGEYIELCYDKFENRYFIWCISLTDLEEYEIDLDINIPFSSMKINDIEITNQDIIDFLQIINNEKGVTNDS